MLAEANYQQATVLIHEYGVGICGGIERGCFLLALKTRNLPDGAKWTNTGGDPLPTWANEGVLLTAKEPERGWGGGGQIAQRVLVDAYKGDPSGARQLMDEHTRNEISFGALRCRILGTLRRNSSSGFPHFAPDVSAPMFDTTQWIVVKPRGEALSCIINALNPSHEEIDKAFRNELVEFGRVRWALDEMCPESAMAQVRPADFLRKRTAVLGMTGQGKSNAVKLIALSIQIAAQRSGAKVGQLLFDPHGEYANETENDRLGQKNYSLASACGTENSFIFTCSPSRAKDGKQQPLLLDFYRMPRAAHELIRRGLASESRDQSGWLNLFLSINLPEWGWKKEGASEPEDAIKLICWWGMLACAGFSHDPQLENEALAGHIKFENSDQIPKVKADVNSISMTKSGWERIQQSIPFPTWFTQHVVINHRGFAQFSLNACKSIVKAYWSYYNTNPEARKEPGAQEIIEFFGDDGTLLSEMAMRKRDGRAILGMDVIKPFSNMHWELSFLRTQYIVSQQLTQKSNSTNQTPPAPRNISVPPPWVVARQLVDMGKLVIIDLSAGDEKLRKLFSETLANDFLEHRKEQNSEADGSDLTEAVIYLEEAHTLVGRKADADDLWPRIAKEGRKMKMGLVLSTQEPSGVNHYVLANAENFFVGYLNNDKELAEISGIGDLGEYTETAKRGMEKGYFRVWCREARPYPLPLQLKLFQDLATQLQDLIKQNKQNNHPAQKK